MRHADYVDAEGAEVEDMLAEHGSSDFKEGSHVGARVGGVFVSVCVSVPEHVDVDGSNQDRLS